MTARIASALAMMIALLCSAAYAGQTFHLSPTGSDEAAGTEAAPWATLEHAAAQVGPGDTVVLGPGEYQGELRPPSGAEGAPIVFRAEPRREAVLTGLPDGDGRYAVELEGVSDLRFEGLVIRTEHPRGRWVRIHEAQRITLEDMRMEDTDNSLALRITESSDVTLRTCELRLSRAGSMARIEDSERIVIEGCAFTRGGHDVLLLWPDRTNRQFIIRGTVFHLATTRGPMVDSVDRILFEDNVITRMLDGGRCAGANIQWYSSDSIYRFNRIYDNWGFNGLSLSPYRDTLDMLGVRAYHNVFDDNSAVGARMVRANRFESVADNSFVNNVFARNDLHADGTDLQVTEGHADQIRFVRNLFSGTITFDGDLLGVDALETAAIRERAGTMFEGNIGGEPGFADPATHDHSPAAGSPMLDGGVPLTTAVGDGQGRTIAVEDARSFFDGFGIEGEVGDLIVVGEQRRQARVVSVDLDAGTLELDRELSWRDGDAVTLPFGGDAPELGVYQEGAEARPTVQIIAEPYRPRPGEAVRLRAVLRGAIEPARIIWHLGDGSLAEGPEVQHRFAEAYDYPVRVEVLTEAGQRWWGASCLVVEEPVDPAAPLVHSNFEDDDADWWVHWQVYRPGSTQWSRVETDEGYSMHVRAPEDTRWMPFRVNPRGWDIDRYPSITVRYRLGEGAPVGAYVEAFMNHEGARRIWLAGTEAAMPLPDAPEDAQVLIDDGQWHTLHLDARAIRERWPSVTVAMRFAFEGQWQTARGQVKEGHEFWVSEVIIGPEQE